MLGEASATGWMFLIVRGKRFRHVTRLDRFALFPSLDEREVSDGVSLVACIRMEATGPLLKDKLVERESNANFVFNFRAIKQE